MVDWMNYSEIQELKRRGLKKTQVARHLNLNRETVTVYWDMAPQEYVLFLVHAFCYSFIKISK